MNKLLISLILGVSSVAAMAQPSKSFVETPIPLTPEAKALNDAFVITKSEDRFYHTNVTLNNGRSRCDQGVIFEETRKQIFTYHKEWARSLAPNMNEKFEEHRQLIMYFSKGTSKEEYPQMTKEHSLRQRDLISAYYANIKNLYTNHFDERLAILDIQMAVSTHSPLTLVCHAVFRFQGNPVKLRMNFNRNPSDNTYSVVFEEANRKAFYEIFNKFFIDPRHNRMTDGYPSIFSMMDNLRKYKENGCGADCFDVETRKAAAMFLAGVYTVKEAFNAGVRF